MRFRVLVCVIVLDFVELVFVLVLDFYRTVVRARFCFVLDQSLIAFVVLCLLSFYCFA